MGDQADLAPPFIAIYETGSDEVEQAGVIMRGVSAFQIKVELHTVPAPAA